ncbi:(+)-neomenthol dehydrogenase-like isoform X2 [Neltuma alba]|uniref:(+)-neomenthol dehydrogenase-like n=1 Tax=Neltuma alba TaxID=207710 RepID=UPI0010A2C3B7|nr:(+)-neomenthol dehydrogenase-like [Prosopis alba]XP_028784278.1 (+)-neomenthol dehydrogenase-like isoform X2 [Prosopis alba]
MAVTTKRYAVVSGGNKGIGFAICKQLASEGITVVLTARDEKRGLDAVDRLRELGLSDHVIFHQLDVTDPASIASLAHFLNTHFGKLDILVNNAAIPGAIVDGDALANSGIEKGLQPNWTKIAAENYELAEEAVRTNYHGAKEMCKSLIPLLQFSNSPTIVMLASMMGTLEFLPKGRLKNVLSDVESLTEEKIEGILKQFLEEFKEGDSLEAKGWPAFMAAYHVSKAALNGYTRILARTYPSWGINAVCPGYVRTDMTKSCGVLSPDEGAEVVVRLALLPNAAPSGLFFYRSEEKPF